jgi:regulator of protease activity HflC (stomatin/prohibitin superfamily)
MIRFHCPGCRTPLRAPEENAGRRTQCPTCGTAVVVPAAAPANPPAAAAVMPAERPASGRRRPAAPVKPRDDLEVVESPARVVLSGAPPVVPAPEVWWQNPVLVWLGSAVVVLVVLLVLLIILANLLKSFWAAVAVLVLLLIVPSYCFLQIVLAKSRAIRDRKEEVNVFGGMVKLVLWEANQGLVFLKNKRIHRTIYGPRDGGGTRFIFPVLGEELKVRVPLTLKLTVFEDQEVLTRESVQLYMKVALWWRVADLEKYYYSVDKQVRVMSTEQLEEVEALDHGRRNPLAAQQDAAEHWLLTLAESCIRKLISQATTATVVSKTATSYLHVEEKHRRTPAGFGPPIQALPGPGQGTVATEEPGDAASPGVLSEEIKRMLEPKVQEYGLEINRVEMQEVRLPKSIQGALDEVFKATLKPAQTEQEARAEQIRLQMAADVLGVETVALQEVMKSFRGSQFIGGMPKFIEALFARAAARHPGAPALG